MQQVALGREISPVIADAELPDNSNLRAIVEDVAGSLKYSFAVAASGDHPSAPGQADQTFRAFLSGRKPKARAAYQEKGRGLLATPISVRSTHFGRYASIDPKLYATLGSDQISNRAGKLQLDGAAVAAALDEHARQQGNDGSSHKPADHKRSNADERADQKAGQALHTMRLYITRVKCIRDTDDQWGGDDIALGGLFVTAAGHTKKVKSFEPSKDDFESGDAVKLGTKRVFAEWDIETKPAGFPYLYTAIVSLAETDDGGFADFLEKLWEHVKAAVVGAVSAAAGIAIGAAIGAAFAGIGALVGAAVGLFIGWLVSLFHNDDDVIGAKTVKVTLAESTKSYYDSRDLTAHGGRTRTLDYKGQGGHYLIDVAFKVDA